MRFLQTKGIDERRLKARVMIHTQDDETECRPYRKRVASLDDYNFISTIMKKPSIAKPLAHGTVAIRHDSVSLLRQIKSDVWTRGETRWNPAGHTNSPSPEQETL